MGNFDWGIIPNDNRPLNIVFFISRNKDNKHLAEAGYKQRRKAFLTCEPIDSPILHTMFYDFANKGLAGEMSRAYYSVNERNPEKVRTALLHFLIDEPNFNLCSIQSKVAGIAAKKENAATKRWMFDFDCTDDNRLIAFIEDIRKIDKMVKIDTYRTPHGYAIITSHGFDTRPLAIHTDVVTLKKDDYLCYDWMTYGGKRNEK